MSRDTLSRAKFSGLDFQTANDEILTRLQVNFASVYNDFSTSSLGVMLIDLFSFGLDSLGFYLDRRASDNYLSTARSAKSVAKLARQLGYKMAPATAASVDILVAPASAQVFITPFPIGFQVTTPDGSTWESRQSYSWPIGNVVPQLLTFSQTRLLDSTYTATGIANQSFRVANVHDREFLVGPGSDGVSQVVCKVDGVEWVEQELITLGATNQFEIAYHDNPPTLRFGDGIAGNIPPVGVQISLTFRSSRGPNGSVTSTQKISPVRPLVVAFTTVNLTLTNPLGSSGGTAPETIEKAKGNAPSYFKARGVNVTKDDYNVRAGTFVSSVFGSVAVASAVTVRSASSDAILQELVGDIVSMSDNQLALVNTFAVLAASSLGTVQTSLADITTRSTDVAVSAATIGTKSTTAKTSLRDAVGHTATISVFSTQTNTASAALDTLIASIVVGADQLSSPTRAIISGYTAQIQAGANNSSTHSSLATSSITVATSALDDISTSATNVTTQTTAINLDVTTASAAATVVSTAAVVLKGSLAVNDGSVDLFGQQIIDHVDSFLSSDCQTNLIEIPILALDPDGFYVSPTIGLQKALQSFLDATKEITQVVKVISGGSLLVEPDISVNCGILQGYVEATVRSRVQTLIVNVLKQRTFGKALRLSELYWVVNTAAIAGLNFVDIKITGPTSKLAAGGDLTVAVNEVVTRGIVTMTSELVKVGTV